MCRKNRIVSPVLELEKSKIEDKVKLINPENNLIVNFSKLKINPVCIKGEFNNHFKNDEHFASVTANFLGVVLPKITSHTYKEICDGGSECKILHYHSVDDIHRKTVRKVLEEYQIPEHTIDQMFEGNDIVEFSASLGHVYAARIVCHKVNNVLHPLFFDTNHHIYMNEKYIKESLFYEHCPTYVSDQCSYMPSECFAFEYLDEELLKESYGYSFVPD